MNRLKSESIFSNGKLVIPGGVSSPGRSFSEVGITPLVIKKGEGKFITDEDNNTYVDFICGLGPNILGHGNKVVQEAINQQFKKGTVYATPNKLEYELAEKIISTSEYLDMVRFTCSGTEATMTAVRIARAVTGRTGILKFKGGYHGHSDLLLSGAVKPSIKNSTKNEFFGSNSFLSTFNDIDSVKNILDEHSKSIAAIIVEPVPSNMGVIPPKQNFLKELRELADFHDIILIFDEVVSGFRHRFGPISDYLQVQPDLITFGKIIGGGLPVGAYGGKKELMETLCSNNGVFQGGTFSGSPLVMSAGIAQLKFLEAENILEKTNELASLLSSSIKSEFESNDISFSAQHFGSLVTPILINGKKSLSSYDDVTLQDKELFSLVYRDLLSWGIAIPPTIEEPIFISACHDDEDVKKLASFFVKSVCKNIKK